MRVFFSLIILCITNLHLSIIYADPVTSALSGAAGSRTYKVIKYRAFDNTQAPIKAISWAERADKPCAFKLEHTFFLFSSLDTCGRGINHPDGIKISYGSGLYITSIKVCLNRAGNKLKGIKTYAKQWLSYPHLRTTGSEVTIVKKRTNCKKWSSKVSCPNNKVALGLKLDVLNGSVSGIRLICDAYI